MNVNVDASVVVDNTAAEILGVIVIVAVYAVVAMSIAVVMTVVVPAVWCNRGVIMILLWSYICDS